MTEENIVLLNDKGKVIGSAPKLASHHENTPLHLAFSVYIFNQDGKILATQRAHHKKVWPDVWTGSCCGHPFPEEEMEAAIRRRVKYELGMQISNIRLVLPDYRYKTPPYNGVIEHEVCPVFVATSTDTPDPNPDEVDSYKWLEWDDFRSLALKDTKDKWSWWCKDQLKQIPKLSLL